MQASLGLEPFQAPLNALVLPLKGFGIILGRPWLKRFRPDIDRSTDIMQVSMGKKIAQLRASARGQSLVPPECVISALETFQAVQGGDHVFLIHVAAVDKRSEPDKMKLPPHPERVFNPQDILYKHADVLGVLPLNKRPPMRDINHTISLEPGSRVRIVGFTANQDKNSCKSNSRSYLSAN